MDANHEEMLAKMDLRCARTEAMHDKMAKFDVHYERMMDGLGKTKTTDFEANAEEMQS
jgi:hypothetical protein